VIGRRLARIAALIGAVGSVALVIYAGRHNNHPFLVVLFALWVLSPFLAFEIATRLSVRWPSHAPAALDGLVVLAALASLAVYSYAVIRPGRAVPFVIVPLVCGSLMLIVVASSVFVAGRRDSNRTR